MLNKAMVMAEGEGKIGFISCINKNNIYLDLGFGLE